MKQGYTHREFPDTDWTSVLAAADGGNEEAVRRALDALCRVYWPPLYSFARRLGLNSDDAQDAIQSFFLKILNKEYFSTVDSAKGRMRAFLRRSLKNHIINSYNREKAGIRGGKVIFIPIDGAVAESAYLAKAGGTAGADDHFDKDWALAMLEKAFGLLEAEYTEGRAGTGEADRKRAAIFESLVSHLKADMTGTTAARIAEELGMTPAAVRKAQERLRARFSVILTALVRETLANPADSDVADEIAALKAALRG